MNTAGAILSVANASVLVGLIVLADQRTKTLVYWRARSFGRSGDRGEAWAIQPDRLRTRYGHEGASLYQDQTTGRWLFRVDGYAASELAALPGRLREALPLTESISLLGAQPCYFFAAEAKKGATGDWFAHFQEYLVALDRAVWKKTARSFVAFHDHTVVVRLISLRQASMVFRRELRQPGNRALARIIMAMQARDLALLRDDRLFDYQTNHGLITCLGLLHYAMDLNEAERHPIARQVARWMATREDFFISDDGVPLEISQTYWKLIYLLMREIEELLNGMGETVTFPKLAKVREFFSEYSIDQRVNRFGNSALGHDLCLVEQPKRVEDGVTCRVFDTGLFVANFALNGRVGSQLVLNAQDVRPWIHGQQSQMAMGYFCDEVFWVDSPGRFTSGKTGLKARIDHYANQSLPTREGCGYVPGWRYVRLEETPQGIIFSFVLKRAGASMLERTVTIGRQGGFTLADSAPGGQVTTRFLLAPGAEAKVEDNILVLTQADHRATFNFSGQPAWEDGLISFQRNVALPTKIFCLRGERVRLAVAGSTPLAGELRAWVSPGYPYRKRELIAQSRPNSWILRISVKKLGLAMLVLLVMDVIAVAVS